MHGDETNPSKRQGSAPSSTVGAREDAPRSSEVFGGQLTGVTTWVFLRATDKERSTTPTVLPAK